MTCYSLDIVVTDKPKFQECPVVLFLALAFADHAFAEFDKPEELFAKRVENGVEIVEICWKPEKLDEPVIKGFKNRHCKMNGAYSYHAWWYQLKWLSIRAGYSQYQKPYNIRRGVAGRIDRMFIP